MPPRFIFLRHGEATHNVAFHEKGDAAFSDPAYEDAPLTEKGKQQAREVGKRLSVLKIIDIWCSPLTRTIETADEIYEENNVETLYLHDNLLERQGGNHICNKRKTSYQLKLLYPSWKQDGLPTSPFLWYDRETELGLYQRMFMLVLMLADIYKNESEDTHILLVSHADAIRALTGKVLKNAEYTNMSLEELRAL
jgi:probable phosphoglycerate mutase